MDNKQQIDAIVKREGDVFTNDPKDRGGPTKFGITQATLSWHLGRLATIEDVKNLDLATAKLIYEKRYILGPGFDKLPPGVLQSNLVDFGVMSGPQLATMHLQEVLGVPADGILGPQSLAALGTADLVAVNKQLVQRRCLMAARLCKKDPNQLRFLIGWMTRFFSFLT
jgi:lysozyme family protein